ncbi:hypothetical protein C8R45DRAFT_920054 [Mycena sanguinolenta]|nr:hypothetical protein C8R45DRAFT_920054 [Mycena sanguinolenta]
MSPSTAPYQRPPGRQPQRDSTWGLEAESMPVRGRISKSPSLLSLHASQATASTPAAPGHFGLCHRSTVILRARGSATSSLRACQALDLPFPCPRPPFRTSNLQAGSRRETQPGALQLSPWLSVSECQVPRPDAPRTSANTVGFSSATLRLRTSKSPRRLNLHASQPGNYIAASTPAAPGHLNPLPPQCSNSLRARAGYLESPRPPSNSAALSRLSPRGRTYHGGPSLAGFSRLSQAHPVVSRRLPYFLQVSIVFVFQSATSVEACHSASTEPATDRRRVRTSLFAATPLPNAFIPRQPLFPWVFLHPLYHSSSVLPRFIGGRVSEAATSSLDLRASPQASAAARSRLACRGGRYHGGASFATFSRVAHAYPVVSRRLPYFLQVSVVFVFQSVTSVEACHPRSPPDDGTTSERISPPRCPVDQSSLCAALARRLHSPSVDLRPIHGQGASSPRQPARVEPYHGSRTPSAPPHFSATSHCRAPFFVQPRRDLRLALFSTVVRPLPASYPDFPAHPSILLLFLRSIVPARLARTPYCTSTTNFRDEKPFFLYRERERGHPTQPRFILVRWVHREETLYQPSDSLLSASISARATGHCERSAYNLGGPPPPHRSPMQGSAIGRAWCEGRGFPTDPTCPPAFNQWQMQLQRASPTWFFSGPGALCASAQRHWDLP